jgi:hypothetical protein
MSAPLNHTKQAEGVIARAHAGPGAHAATVQTDAIAPAPDAVPAHHTHARARTRAPTRALTQVYGIVTKASLVRPKLVRSVHYCPDTGVTSAREYRDITALTGLPTGGLVCVCVCACVCVCVCVCVKLRWCAGVGVGEAQWCGACVRDCSASTAQQSTAQHSAAQHSAA